MKNLPIATRRSHEHPRRGGAVRSILSILLVVGIAGGLIIAIVSRPEKIGRRADEDSRSKYAETADVFGSSGSPATDSSERATAADAFFVALSNSLGRGDQAAFAKSFDAKRIYQEIERQDVLPSFDWRQERDFITGLQLGLGRSMTDYGGMEWESQEIRKVVNLERSNEFLVFVRARHVEGYSVKMRWWLIENGGTVRAYDWEDLDGGWRSSTAMGVMAAGSLGSAAPWVNQVQRLIEVAPLIMDGDIEYATQTLERLAGARFPANFESMRLMFLASAYNAAERYDAALAAIDQAAALNAEMPILEYLRAVANNGLARHDKALAAAEAYIALLGPDAEVLLEVGDARLGLGRVDAAADAYRAGLRENADAVDNLYGLARCLPDGGQAELLEWFEKARTPSESFEGLAILMLDGGELEAIELLSSRLDAMHPGDPNAAYYLAEVRFAQERYSEAATLWEDAMPRAAADERPLFAERRAEALVAAGDSLTAYRESGDPVAAFRSIAGILAAREDADALRALLPVHRAAAPDDIWLGFFGGIVLALDGNHDAASDAFSAGYRSAGDDETRDVFHQALVTALYDAGRMMHAYETLEDKRVVARQIAALLFESEDANGFAQLVEAHRANDPRDPALHMWQAETHWLRGEYETVLTTISTHRERILAHNPEAVYLVEERTIRSAIRLGRFDEALEAARRSTARDGDPYYEAVVHAASGREDDTLAVIRRCVALGYDPETFYQDADAGRVLSTEGFREVRRLFPPSADNRTSAAGENADG